MDYDEVIEQVIDVVMAEVMVTRATASDIARAAFPILAEYGARLMLGNIRGRAGYIDLAALDPATIVREAVK